KICCLCGRASSSLAGGTNGIKGIGSFRHCLGVTSEERPPALHPGAKSTPQRPNSGHPARHESLQACSNRHRPTGAFLKAGTRTKK
ncbi:MAG: hypothetical protein WCJ64_16330, partial [Rhodospirillaceae bacterium]